MLIYVSRRLLWTPVLLFFAGLFIFSLSSITPGDPAELMAGQRADPEAIERIRDRLGLNDPFMVQYLRYISDAFKGDLGESYRYRGRDVVELLAPRLKVSLELNIVSYFVTLIIGLPLGFWAAMRQGTWKDPTATTFMLLVYALPVFFTAPFLILVFALWLDWIPVSGWSGIFSTQAILPAVTLGVPGAFVFMRYMRASTLDVLGQEFVRTAHGKGMGHMTVNRRHIARNALIPIMTILGFSLAGMFGGSLIVELIYGIPGVARLSLEAVFQRDYPLLMALTILGTTMLALANLFTDIMYSVIDPRIRLRA
ncbi:MAG: ABC transporter permease [Chloroflexi bacterium]|nr:ABC transporter permease [Chloroflexota bacterium]MYK61146.1 ABC transporter permease [Chloroflexota bacterium]